MPPLLPNETTKLNDFQHALISFSHLLEKELWKVEPQKVGERAVKILEGTEAQVAVALERFGNFLFHKSAGVI